MVKVFFSLSTPLYHIYDFVSAGLQILLCRMMLGYQTTTELSFLLATNTYSMHKKGSDFVPVWIHILLLLKTDWFRIPSTQEKLKVELKLTKGLCNKNVFKIQYTD
jgi:hypothetical protein